MLGWALGLVAVTTVGLAVLAWALVMMHGLTYGALTVLGTDIEAPDLDRYAVALGVGALTNLGVGLGAAWLAEGTRARRWPAWAVGVLAALLAAVVAGSVLLLMVGISPVDLVLGL